MVATIGIPLVLILSFFLYRILTRWLERRDAGTVATFIAFGSSCCLFIFEFLPLEFPRTWRFFGVLACVALPFVVLTKRRELSPLSLPLQEHNSWKKFFEEGDTL